MKSRPNDYCKKPHLVSVDRIMPRAPLGCRLTVKSAVPRVHDGQEWDELSLRLIVALSRGACVHGTDCQTTAQRRRGPGPAACEDGLLHGCATRALYCALCTVYGILYTVYCVCVCACGRCRRGRTKQDRRPSAPSVHCAQEAAQAGGHRASEAQTRLGAS